MPDKYDVILFAGQSNMQGQCEAPTDHSKVDGAMEYRFLSDELVPLRDPVGEDIRSDGTAGFEFNDETCKIWHSIHVLGGPVSGYGTLIPSFARAYGTGCGRKMVAVSAAKGATAMKEWLPGAPCCEALLRKGSAALRKVGEAASDTGPSVVWLQGESDAIEGRTRAQYKADLLSFAEYLRCKIGVRRFGIIRVGRFTDDERDLAIMDAQDELCRDDPFFLMLTRDAAGMRDEPVFMNPAAHGHYSVLGLEKLGRAAGSALAEEMCRLNGMK